MTTTQVPIGQECADCIRPQRRVGQASLFQNVANPIPNEVEDSSELLKFFQTYNFVPYAGSYLHSGHSLLVWYLALAKLSSTTGAAIKKLNSYAFGSKAMFVRTEDPEYSLGIEAQPLSTVEAQTYLDALKTYVTFDCNVSEFHKKIGWSEKVTGNAWVEMSIAEKLGERRVHFRYHKPLQVLYLNTKPGEAKIAVVSPVWTESYLREKPARQIPIYPNFVREKGVLKTMFHLKTGQNDWYGRPDTDFVDLQKNNEAQNALYLIKATNTNFTPRVIMEIEENGINPTIDDDQARKDGYDDYYDQLEQNLTNLGERPQGFVFVTRPFGARPMMIKEIAPNTNENWYKTIGAENSGAILRAFGLSPGFLGFEVTRGLSGQDGYGMDYLWNNEPAINEHLNRITNFTNSLLTAAWNALEIDLNYASLTFTTPVKNALEDLKNGNDGTDNSMGSDTVQPGGG